MILLVHCACPFFVELAGFPELVDAQQSTTKRITATSSDFYPTGNHQGFRRIHGIRHEFGCWPKFRPSRSSGRAQWRFARVVVGVECVMLLLRRQARRPSFEPTAICATRTDSYCALLGDEILELIKAPRLIPVTQPASASIAFRPHRVIGALHTNLGSILAHSRNEPQPTVVMRVEEGHIARSHHDVDGVDVPPNICCTGRLGGRAGLRSKKLETL